MNLIKNVKRVITDKDYRDELFYTYVANQFCDDETIIKKMFRLKMGYELDLTNPKTFNEKLQWIKLYDRKKEYVKYVDKYLVREYIADTIGEQYLIPLLGVYEKSDDIDFDKLPNRFVLKCNHNSGTGMYICKDKSAMNISKVKKGLDKGLKEDYYRGAGREWPYKEVPRRIVCEAYMEDENGVLNDYKVLCFDGKPYYIEYHSGRFTGDHRQDWYDINWNKTSITQSEMPCTDSAVEQPECFEEMLELSRKLSKGIPHVRVDWYCAKGKLYFGEMTFFDGSGYVPFDDFQIDVMLGNLIKLPKTKKQ